MGGVVGVKGIDPDQRGVHREPRHALYDPNYNRLTRV